MDLSGGEKKRNEMVQLAVLKPKIAVLDELDSGLDVDALRDVSRRVEQATTDWNLGVLAITHYTRLLRELKPDVVHVLSQGRIVRTGGPELADELEATGYAPYGATDDAAAPPTNGKTKADDPLADPFAAAWFDRNTPAACDSHVKTGIRASSGLARRWSLLTAGESMSKSLSWGATLSRSVLRSVSMLKMGMLSLSSRCRLAPAH